MVGNIVLETSLADLPVRRGKVRDIYELGDQLLLVSTDRISAFDWILPTGIPDKGRVLTQISGWWFGRLDTPHHMITMDLDQVELPEQIDRKLLAGRTMLVRKAEVVPVECVVRGYLAGSGWAEYQQSGAVCGVRLPKGLRESDQLPEPIFTPATKAEQGEHDENIPLETMIDLIGKELAETLRDWSIDLYVRGAKHARERGILIADTKFEFGLVDGQPLLIDEVLTPDSSRFWPADEYSPGRGQASFDKQFVRDWLIESDWDKNSPPPELPAPIVAKTRGKYITAYEQLTGQEFAES
jgi:phosphoribosylaminoimidazole-succinocarboxamide synthase